MQRHFGGFLTPLIVVGQSGDTRLYQKSLQKIGSQRLFCLPQISRIHADFSSVNRQIASAKICVICGRFTDETASGGYAEQLRFGLYAIS